MPIVTGMHACFLRLEDKLSEYQLYKTHDEHGRAHYFDAIAGVWVTEVVDDAAYDSIRMKMELIHQADYTDKGDVLQRAGAMFILPGQRALDEFRGKPNSLDEVILDRVVKLATDAASLLLDHRRMIGHEHTKHVRGES